ncbi:hypothetical protein E4T66_16045 [Sinimarinibacterium sp. CAU 1509]|uniref:hypothetical protein n=1 Tax=Sinimarinibacterium sp. CAU 1509 TaxID=2562283 RepID=UPI0010AD270C|nr:hypothetical protein [Sinimarinibacterium sp. CAU 1509]TJY58208.1 hypothetical protein E4T66_16045 [Sinimarinibacterium sp. CAU 1509]
MFKRFLPSARLLAACVLGLGLSACLPDLIRPSAAMEPVPGYVTDLSRFDAFIAKHPTPEEFRSSYPDVQLILPGEMSTKELRFNNSRYFATLDEDKKYIVGGRFQ